ncbi:hypothetical protein N0V94_007964 [Neodidymelliopsis sp. IMI 364377]|nr:hypothetical protein N0V94_007964 [Neodidymelliopsis sp. IMI 364377]
MSGLTVEDPISLIENDVPNESTILREEVAVQGYDSDISEDDDDELNYVTVQDKTFSTPGIAPAPQHADPTEFEIPSYRLACGVVYPGSVVEMQDRSERKPDVLISGDFLFVKAVIEYVEPEKVVLRGYRLRRSQAKLNELFMLIHTNVNDERAPFDQGLEDIDINEFLNIRKCYQHGSQTTGSRSSRGSSEKAH